jgi:hypothetical protein
MFNLFGFADELMIDVTGDHVLGTTIHFMKENTVSHFNLLTKSQITFEIDRQFPYINKTVTTKDKRLFIIGYEKAFEFYLAANSL